MNAPDSTFTLRAGFTFQVLLLHFCMCMLGLTYMPSVQAITRINVAAAQLGDGVARSANVTLDLAQGAIDVRATDVTVGKRKWGPIAVVCTGRSKPDTLACETLRITLGQETWVGQAALGVAGSTVTLTQVRDGAITTASVTNERFELMVDRDGQTQARLAGLDLQRLNAWLPKNGPQWTAGTAELRAAFRLAADVPAGGIDAVLVLNGGAFADTAGLRAAENIALQVEGRLTKADKDKPWRISLAGRHDRGDVFWQPAFVKTDGHRWALDASLAADRYSIHSASVWLAGIGEIAATAEGRTDAQDAWAAVERLQLTSTDLSLAQLHETVIKPMVGGSLIAELALSGTAKAELDIKRGRFTRILATFKNVDIVDPSNRLTIKGLRGEIPWVAGEATGAVMRWDTALFYRVPIGPVALPIALSPQAIEMRDVRIPILDGAIEIDRFAGDQADGTWPIVLAGRIAPIGMRGLTKALGMPEMAGTLAAELPGMVYHQRALTINGDFRLRVFDGDIVANAVRIEEALGKTPRLTGTVTARRIDLGLLTETFKFGRIEGRIDADLTDMELVSWRPNRVDARIMSSAGDYRRKISQQAVQNISSLGGAGAAAAIQRSVLRFFEEFGYEKLGLTCRLRLAVCDMGGVEDAPQGYILVKGGGIPAITVLGYNRRVSWQELVRRVQAAIESNEKPIIR
jgi:hypothetical protein